MKARAAAGAAALLPALLLAGCGGGDGAAADPAPSASTGLRPVSADEADRLAVARYNDYKRGRAPITLTVPVGDQVLTMVGRIDFRDHRGIASLATDDDPPSYAVIAWNLASFATYATSGSVEPSALGRAPTSGWTKPIDLTSTAVLPEVLRVALNLASDRPDNAQLLRQNGAQWRGATTLDGTAVDLMSARPDGDGQTITYYVDATGNLLRADVVLPDSIRPATILIGSGTTSTVPVVKVLGTPPDTTGGSGFG